MPLPKRFPHTVKVGSASVTIYRNYADKERQYPSFIVVDYLTSQRRRQRFNSYPAALAEANRVAVNLSNQDVAAGGIDFRDAASLIQCRQLLEGLDISLEGAIEAFAQSAKLVGAHRVIEAAVEHARRHPITMEKIPIAKAADDYFDALQARGQSERYLQDVKARLGRFIIDHPKQQLHEITTGLLQHWIDRLSRTDRSPQSAVSKRNFATITSGFFEYWRKRGKISVNPAADLERQKIKSTEDVQFWNPEEATAILRAIAPPAISAMAVSLFAGVRTSEICRLRRSDFNFDSNHIALGGDRTKTRSRRLTPIQPNLKDWLVSTGFISAEPGALLWPTSSKHLTRTVSEACASASVRRVANGGRHSCITYKIALTGDVARTAVESGNSPEVINSAYRGLATEADGKRYFQITPDSVQRVG